MRPLRVVMSVALAVSVFVGGTAHANPSAAWRIVASPAPSGSQGGSLAAVSCISLRACTAVGLYELSGQDVTLAEHWNGSAWTVQETPNPSGATYSELTGVSCTAPEVCIAVGFSITAASEVRPLAERLSGSTWFIERTPIRSSAVWAILDAVSCIAPTDCTATGGSINNGTDDQEQPFVERWNGTSWSIQHVPNPQAENGSSLNGVSCTSPQGCESVGGYAFGDVDQAVLAFRWNGSVWRLQRERDPGGSELSDQSSVSCAAASECTAAGYWNDAAGRTRPLAERFAGGVWKMQPVPDPSGAVTAQLNGVSCPTTTICTAVGDSSTNLNAYPQVPIAEVWTSAGWAVQPTPVPAGLTTGSLSGIDCPSPGNCIAVGGAEIGGRFSPLIEVHSR